MNAFEQLSSILQQNTENTLIGNPNNLDESIAYNYSEIISEEEENNLNS
jgi:hypothetical protein